MVQRWRLCCCATKKQDRRHAKWRLQSAGDESVDAHTLSEHTSTPVEENIGNLVSFEPHFVEFKPWHWPSLNKTQELKVQSDDNWNIIDG